MRRLFATALAATALTPIAARAANLPPLPVGTTSTSPTVASGGDSRIVGAVQATGGDASATRALDAGAPTPRTLADWMVSVAVPATSVATCDGLTNDSAALSTLSYALPKGSVIQMPRGRECYIGSNLDLAPGVMLRGAPGAIDNPGGTNQSVLYAVNRAGFFGG